MPIRTIGVEEELLVVDPVSWRPVPGADAVRAAAEQRAVEPPEHELKLQQTEIASAPHTGVAEVVADLRRRRAEIAEAAREQGLAVAALATSPLAVRPQSTPDDRYRRMERRFGLLAHRQLTCGMHVHVSTESRDEAVQALDRIRPWLPVLVALAANSPFWQGEDSGYASYRSTVWGEWPTAGPTEPFGDARTYDAVLRDLLATDTILDDGMIYFDARLSAHFPTLEIRVADVTTSLTHAGLVAALARALVDGAVSGLLPGVPVRTELVRLAAWRAAASGMSESLVDPTAVTARPAAELVAELLDRLQPALAANGDEAFVRKAVAQVLADGTGAQHQRGVAESTGTLEAVVADAVQRTAAA